MIYGFTADGPVEKEEKGKGGWGRGLSEVVLSNYTPNRQKN